MNILSSNLWRDIFKQYSNCEYGQAGFYEGDGVFLERIQKMMKLGDSGDNQEGEGASSDTGDKQKNDCDGFGDGRKEVYEICKVP